MDLPRFCFLQNSISSTLYVLHPDACLSVSTEEVASHSLDLWEFNEIGVGILHDILKATINKAQANSTFSSLSLLNLLLSGKVISRKAKDQA